MEKISVEAVGIVLALIVGFYTLLIQTKKNMLAVNAVIVLVVFATAISTLYYVVRVVAAVVVAYRTQAALQPLVFGLDLLILLFSGWVLWIFLKDYTAQKYFRSDVAVLSSRWWSAAKRQFGFYGEEWADDRLKARGDANHGSLAHIFRVFFNAQPNDNLDFLDYALEKHNAMSVLVTKADNATHSKELANLALYVLEHDGFVQFVGCSRHPVEFLEDLTVAFGVRHLAAAPNEPIASTMRSEDAGEAEEQRRKIQLETWLGQRPSKRGGDPKNFKERLVLVDAHSPHFGFDEPIYFRKTRNTSAYVLDTVRSGYSYPSIHSALVRGFKTLQKTNRDKKGQFGVIIFEDMSALVDIDSKEQFNIFVRHLVASERLMNGVLTVIYESANAVRSHPFLADVTDHHFRFHELHDVAYPTWQIRHQLEEVAADVGRWLAGEMARNGPVVLLAVRQGGCPFAADLTAALRKQCVTKDFDRLVTSAEVKLSLYGENETPDPANAKIEGLENTDFTGKSVLLIDDIWHTGTTLTMIADAVRERGAREAVSVVAISRPQGEGAPNYRMFSYDDRFASLPNAWLYGYGMDRKEDDATRRISCFVFDRRD